MKPLSAICFQLCHSEYCEKSTIRLLEEPTTRPWYSTPICPSGKVPSWLSNCSGSHGFMPGKQRRCSSATAS
jgi:hypothetical protein